MNGSRRVRASASGDGRRPFLLLPLLPLLLGVGACGNGPGGNILIGLAGPMGQGSGRSMRQAAEMAVAEINQAGGIDGATIGLVVKDDGADPEQGIAVAAELRDDARVVAVVGHINSSVTLAAARIYNDPVNPVVELSPASSSPEITPAGPWTFRVCPTDLQHGPALAAWAIERLDADRATVLYANDAYGRGVLASFARAFQNAGGALTAPNPYLPDMLGTGEEIQPYLRRAMRRGTEALMIAGQAEAGLKIIEQARALGYTGPVLGADGMTGLRDMGESAEGTYISSAFLPDRPTPEARAFVQAYQRRFEQAPDHRAAMTYDAILLLARAIEEVGADRAAIRDYLDRVGDEEPAFDGASGTIAFDENGDVAGKEVTIGVIRDGNLVTATGQESTAGADSAAVAVME
ncbi:MAG: ABC transporter substrate-binding protein [Longimicrobiales bacterium]